MVMQGMPRHISTLPLFVRLTAPVTCCSDPACRLFNMGECIRGWPVRVVSPPEAKHYYWAELGWYIHLTLKHVLG